MFRLDEKIVVVTGGSRGIGRACAEACGELGATVIVNYRSGEAEARSVAESIAAKGGKAEICGFDVSDTKATETAFEQIIEKHKRIDVLVANAGIAIDGLLLRLKDEDLQKLFDVNVKGSLTCARVAMRSMMRQKKVASSSSPASSAKWATWAKPPTRPAKPRCSGSPSRSRVSSPHATSRSMPSRRGSSTPT